MARKKIVKNEDEEEVLDTQDESSEQADESAEQDIEVNDPLKLRPVELPLVVKLPVGASKAQEAYAKTLNAYAYQNPAKWEMKKGKLIEKLRSLKNAPDPVESNLKVNNSGS